MRPAPRRGAIVRGGFARRVAHPLEPAVGQHPIAPPFLAAPALRVFDPGDGAVRRFEVEALVGIDHLEGSGMRAIDHQVQMDVIGIDMQAVNGLMPG